MPDPPPSPPMTLNDTFRLTPLQWRASTQSISGQNIYGDYITVQNISVQNTVGHSVQLWVSGRAVVVTMAALTTSHDSPEATFSDSTTD